MYSEWIKSLKPKPYMNLTWYQGEDEYSEGYLVEDIHDEVYESQVIANLA